MFLFLLLALWTAHQTQAHLTYPIVYCNMASTCIHDNRMVCASTMDGCSRRTFLDQCDMYEYNCDYGTRYQETYRLLCSVQYDENGFPQATTMKESTTTTKLSSTTLKTTTELPTTTTTLITKETSQIETIVETSPETTTKNLTSALPVATVSLDSTKKTEQVNTVCCHRPKTWETTTENAKTILFFPSVDLNTIEMDKSEDNSFEEEIVTTTELETTRQEPVTNKTFISPETSTQKTTNTVAKTTVPIKSTYPSTTTYTKKLPSSTVFEIDTFPSTVVSETIAATEVTQHTNNFTESCRNKTSEVPTKSSKCCDRPQTWETTTEGEVKTYTIPKSSDSTTPSRPTATSKRSSVSTTPRPLTTTCKQYHIDINDFITTSLDTSTNVISTTASPKNEEKPISSDSSYLSDDNIYISDSSPEVIPIISKEARSTTSKREKVKKRTTSAESETIMSVVNKKTTLKAKDFPSKIILTHKITNSMKYSQSQSWWYPTVCNSKRCQRPVTWETTMRRKKYHGHH